MTILQVSPLAAIDASAHDVISTFMSHVTTLTGYRKQRIEKITGIRSLLFAAIAHGERLDWCRLYDAIADLIESALDVIETRAAQAYFRAFLRENADLAQSATMIDLFPPPANDAVTRTVLVGSHLS